ncbi:MAG: glycosyltransferase [Cyclobacteriaceae bacterium]|nr:glycosyltransferase [Cyclobacteriaceae bacterium]
MPKYSVIVPVYNRPAEIRELLDSFCGQSFTDYELLIVEDGSTLPSAETVAEYTAKLPVSYFIKPNEGPGPTRNFGASHARGQWVIFLDSDCLLSEGYFHAIENYLELNPDVDAFGGPDATHPSFSPIQKAIGYSMTSFFTTGGIRGGKKASLEKFKPRSFNMGMKKEVFDQLGGFSSLRFGEDIDLSLRLENSGYCSVPIPGAWVFHKRRATLRQFYKQVYNSGMARIVLGQLHPRSLKAVHLMPVAFLVYHLILLTSTVWFVHLGGLLALYPLLILADSLRATRQLSVAFLSIASAYVQLTGYGLGFLHSFWRVHVRKKGPDFAFRHNFYQ